jgi:hypothetical protein
MKRVFIQAAEQISIQQPLSEQWMEHPESYSEPFIQAVNPSFRDYIAPNEVRRMGNLMRRALVTTLKVLNETGINNPDAIITATSTGSLDYTERLLDALTTDGEETLSPTYFMQSTHNTVGSALAIYTKTKGYNTTYSHGTQSFDDALLDAWMQMQLDKIRTALVGGHDEMIASYFELLKKAGYVGTPDMVPCGEVAMSMLVTTDKHTDNLCELASISFGQCPVTEEIDAVMTGINGQTANDIHYQQLLHSLFPGKPHLHYKHLFGENFTVSALGVYAAAHCLKKGYIPEHMYVTDSVRLEHSPRNILLVNQMSGQLSFILLKAL